VAASSWNARRFLSIGRPEIAASWPTLGPPALHVTRSSSANRAGRRFVSSWCWRWAAGVYPTRPVHLTGGDGMPHDWLTPVNTVTHPRGSTGTIGRSCRSSFGATISASGNVVIPARAGRRGSDKPSNDDQPSADRELANRLRGPDQSPETQRQLGPP
jgi:hypothetical protein